MASDIPWLEELGGLSRSGSPARAAEAVDKLTTLFLEQAPRLAQAHVALFDEIILRLARDIEFQARIRLAERLADSAQGPPQIVRELASDDRIQVAGPVLERSASLRDEDLIAVASTKSQQHLLAISRRPRLSEGVTDVLIERGQAEVALSVAANRGARISEAACAKLAERAKADPGLAGVLKMRQDLPAGMIALFVSIALVHARKTLEAEFGHQDLDEIVEEAAAAATQASATASLTDNLSQAFLEASRANKRGELDERRICEWLVAGRVDRGIAGVACLARIPVQIVARAFHAPDWQPLLILLRALRYDARTFELFLTSRAGRRLPPALQHKTRHAFLDMPIAEAEAALKKILTQARGGPPSGASKAERGRDS